MLPSFSSIKSEPSFCKDLSLMEPEIYRIWSIKSICNMFNIVVGVCYRLPDWEEVNETFFIQLEEVSQLSVPVLMEDLNLPSIYAGRTTQQDSSNTGGF